jgi:hypothetical protein
MSSETGQEKTNFQKFDSTMRKILSVSKEELDKREKNWQRKQKRKRAKKKRATSKPASPGLAAGWPVSG